MTNALLVAIAVLCLVIGCTADNGSIPSPAHLSSDACRGAETLGQIHSAFYLPDQHLYGEEIGPSRGRPKPAFVWPSSIMLSALASAADLDRDTYLPLLREYIDALRPFRTNHNGLTGLDVWPAPKSPDRYYDDNAWMALALIEAYAVTQDPRDLAFAEESLRFTLTGEDTKLDGGIYWHEDRPDKKHTVSTAPTVSAAILLYQATKNPDYLAAAKRLYQWTATHLQEVGGAGGADGIYADNISVADGKIDHSSYSYNTGAMIRAACLLYSTTHDPCYLDDARRSASAAEKRWAPEGAAIHDESPIALKLAEAWMVLYQTDHDPHSLDLATRSIDYLHSHCRDPNGWYSKRWDDRDVAALDPARLLDQAAAARAFLLLALTPPTPQK